MGQGESEGMRVTPACLGVSRELRIKYEQQKEQMAALALRCTAADDMYVFKGATVGLLYCQGAPVSQDVRRCFVAVTYTMSGARPQATCEDGGAGYCACGGAGGGAAEGRSRRDPALGNGGKSSRGRGCVQGNAGGIAGMC